MVVEMRRVAGYDGTRRFDAKPAERTKKRSCSGVHVERSGSGIRDTIEPGTWKGWLVGVSLARPAMVSGAGSPKNHTRPRDSGFHPIRIPILVLSQVHCRRVSNDSNPSGCVCNNGLKIAGGQGGDRAAADCGISLSPVSPPRPHSPLFSPFHHRLAARIAKPIPSAANPILIRRSIIQL